jgi:hypothetical protein
MSELTKSDFAELGSQVEKQIDIQVDRMRRRTDNGQHWTLDKKVPIGLMLALVAQFALGVWVVANDRAEVNSKIALIAADVKVLHETDLETRDLLRETVQRISVAIEKMDVKLERLMERK